MGTPRPPRPNNVVALSHYRARLGRGRRLRRADALLEAPDLGAAVRALPGDELYYVLHEIGLTEGAEILAAATAEQLSVVLDFALWERDQISPEALAEWLEAMAAAPFERIGRWLAGLDTELVGLILRRGARIYRSDAGGAARTSRRGRSSRRPTASSCSTSASRRSEARRATRTGPIRRAR